MEMKTTEICQEEKGIKYCSKMKIFKATANLLATLAFNHAASVASTDVCEMLTFITSTCRSSLSEGVTLTAFSI